MIILTSGMEIFGSGDTEEAAIQDAIQNAAYWTGEAWANCTREWIAEQIAVFAGIVGKGLYFSEG